MRSCQLCSWNTNKGLGQLGGAISQEDCTTQRDKLNRGLVLGYNPTSYDRLEEGGSLDGGR